MASRMLKTSIWKIWHRWTNAWNSPAHAQIIVQICPFFCALNPFTFIKAVPNKRIIFKIIASIASSLHGQSSEDADESNPYETKIATSVGIWLLPLFPVEKEYDDETRHMPIRYFFHYLRDRLCRGNFPAVTRKGHIYRDIPSTSKDTKGL